MKDRDTNRQMAYVLDACLWSGGFDTTVDFCTAIDFDDWAAFAEMVFTDALARPYHNQIRRTRRTRALDVTRLAATSCENALATLNRDAIAVRPDRTFRWLALHEVAHLLAPASSRAPHYWRWVDIYSQMIDRHVSRYAASQYLGLANCFGVAFAPPHAASRRSA